MRAAAVPLLVLLCGALASGSALAGKGGGKGGHAGGGHTGGHKGGAHHGGGHKGNHHHGGGHKGSHHHGGHHHHGSVAVGVGFGFSYWDPFWYPAPYYYPAQPATYIEQSAPPQPVGWWYYCESARAYYPYVNACPTGWQRVPATPPPPN
jgi:hypothetical protein